MQLDAILEVTIGLVLTWLVISIGVMQVQEWMENWLSWRSQYLERAVRGMLEDETMSAQFFTHPSIKALYRKSGKNIMPPSIPPERFAKVILDIFVNAGKPVDQMPEGQWSIEKMQHQLKEMQKTHPELALKLGYIFKGIDDTSEALEKKLAEWHKGIEDWFNDAMSMVSMEYRKNAQKWAFLIGLFIAALLNVDTINIATQLWREPLLRETIVAQAEAQVAAGITDYQSVVADLQLPVGWNAKSTPVDLSGWLLKAFGLVLSGAAAAQGAPFWFDALRKLVGFKSQSSQKSKSD